MTFLRQQFKGFFVRICAGFRTSQILSSLFLVVTFKRETVSATGCCQKVRISHSKSFGLTRRCGWTRGFPTSRMSVTGQQRIPTLTLTAVLRLFTRECPGLGLWMVKSFFTGLMKESASIMSLTWIFFAHLFGPKLDAKLHIRIFGGNKMVPPHILWRLLETG